MIEMPDISDSELDYYHCDDCDIILYNLADIKEHIEKMDHPLGTYTVSTGFKDNIKVNLE